jgi:hypothetical protein
MAEVTAMRSNALPYAVYGLPYTIVFPMLDADGDLVTGATTPDAEISKNGDTAADCTNESTEIATNTGGYYLTLTGTELTTDVALIYAKSATAGMKTTVATLYPRKLPTVRAGTSASGGVSTSTVVLDASASQIDDFYNGCIVSIVIDGASVPEVRMITDYVGSTQTCTVHADFTAAPDNTDPFTIYMTDVALMRNVNVSGWNGTAVASPHTAGYPVVTVKDGTGTGEIDTTSGGVLVAAFAANSITAAAIADSAIDANTFAAGAITAAAIADGAIDAATFAAGAITATVIATGAIDADAIADNAIDSGAFAAGAITAAAIADGAIDAATFAAGAITAAAIATDAIDNDAIAANAVTEIQSGLATSASISALNNLSAAQVNAEVVDALATDTYAEPGQGSPAATTTLSAKINYLYKAWRNKSTATSSEYALYADDGTTKDHEATLADDGTTFTRGEVSTGA